MKIQTYAIYDSKAAVFSQPFFTQNNEVAIRSFSVTANDPQSNVSRFPADFSLHHIGEYDDETGVLTPQKPNNLGLAAQFQTSKE